MTLTRAVTPTHLPSGELKRDGVLANVDGSTEPRRPLAASYCKGGEFSVKYTSAGECDPSVTIWSASTSSSSLRRLTVMPLFFRTPPPGRASSGRVDPNRRSASPLNRPTRCSRRTRLQHRAANIGQTAVMRARRTPRPRARPRAPRIVPCTSPTWNIFKLGCPNFRMPSEGRQPRSTLRTRAVWRLPRRQGRPGPPAGSTARRRSGRGCAPPAGPRPRPPRPAAWPGPWRRGRAPG